MKPLLPQDEALLRRTLTAGLTDDEHALFVRTCNRSGLDPFARQIYIKRRDGETQFLATIDGFRLTAERTGKYAGQIGPHWCGPDGVWKSVWTAKEPPTAARIGVLRSDFKKPVWGKALYSEFTQGGEFWEGMPRNQLAKCAEALAFRKAFPKELSGLYTHEEIERVPAKAAVNPPLPRPVADRGNHVTFPRPVPPALQPFVEKGFGDRKNVQSGFAFIQGELAHELGDEGRRVFREIYLRLPRIFKTREACAAAHLDCWLEMWSHVEEIKREAA